MTADKLTEREEKCSPSKQTNKKKKKKKYFGVGKSIKEGKIERSLNIPTLTNIEIKIKIKRIEKENKRKKANLFAHHECLTKLSIYSKAMLDLVIITKQAKCSFLLVHNSMLHTKNNIFFNAV